MPQIKDIAINKTTAENSDLLIMQNPVTGETYSIAKSNLLGSLATNSAGAGVWEYSSNNLTVFALPNRLIIDSLSTVEITMPTNLTNGGDIELKQLKSSGKIRIKGLNKINGLTLSQGDNVFLKYSTDSVKLVYINSDYGWATIPDSFAVISDDLILPTTGLQQKFFAGDIINTSDNAPLSRWSDTSGNSRNAIQTSINSQPVYKKFELNGVLPSVYFDGLGFFSTDLSYLQNQKYLIAVVEGRTVSNAPNYLFGMASVTTNQALHIGWRTNTSFTLAQHGNDLDATNLNGYSNFSPNIWILVNNSSGHSIWRNGSQIASNTNTTNLSSGVNGRLGRAVTSNFTGHLGLVAAYTGASLPDISSLFTAINKHYRVY